MVEQDDEVIIVVTAFGPWKNLSRNPSWEIASRLPSHLPSTFSSPAIRIILAPSGADGPEPIRVSYHDILSTVPPLLKEHNPDIVLHMGLDEGRTFFGIEQGAQRDGYHQNLDLDRKVFTKIENRKLWGKYPERLETMLDLRDVELRWKTGLGRGKGKGGAPDVRHSDDAGDFVCGFIYYATLFAMGDRRDAVFLHVPTLKDGEVQRGVEVVEELIRALAGSWRDSRAE
ncbi:hypothetical protein B0O99DRAFT_617453 [Bisporella sp. PMI_857]|nr:hypothetical protein B0O99DRAFT_617453 [Bisporella sp. PMI_857]